MSHPQFPGDLQAQADAHVPKRLRGRLSQGKRWATPAQRLEMDQFLALWHQAVEEQQIWGSQP